MRTVRQRLKDSTPCAGESPDLAMLLATPELDALLARMSAEADAMLASLPDCTNEQLAALLDGPNAGRHPDI